MSLTSILCKIFRFSLAIFKQVINTIAEAVKTVGTAVIDVLDDLILGTGGSIVSKLGLFLLVGAGAYFFLTRDDDEDKRPTTT